MVLGVRKLFVLLVFVLVARIGAQEFLESESIPVPDLFPPELQDPGSFAVERGDFCLCYDVAIPTLSLDPLCIQFTDTYEFVYENIVSLSPLGCRGLCPCSGFNPNQCFTEFNCTPAFCQNLTRSCYTGPSGTEGVGLCMGGNETCINFEPSGCLGEVTPVPEVCDGLDNNCNHLVDELWPNLGQNCSNGLGMCLRYGEYVCGIFQNVSVCDAIPGIPQAERCNSTLDWNCNGLPGCLDPACFFSPYCANETDWQCLYDECSDPWCEDIELACYTGPPGTEGVGICVGGMTGCDNGGNFFNCTGEITPQPENCTDPTQDLNCDGYVGCGDASCQSVPECVNDTVAKCFGFLECNVTLCEGINRECYTGPPDTLNVGVCRAGNQTCLGGERSNCTGEILPSDEHCNDPITDWDCDGFAGCFDPDCFDNPFCTNVTVDYCLNISCAYPPCAGVNRTCYNGPNGTEGVGLCSAGLEGCSMSLVPFNCTGEVYPVDEICDGLDNNCNHLVDELWPDIGDFCTDGVGICQGNGTMQCNGYQNDTVCSVMGTPEFDFLSVMTVDEYSPSTWVFTIDANITSCEAGLAEIFSYVLNRGVYFGEVQVPYQNVIIDTVNATGDCAINPAFNDYEFPRDDLSPGDRVHEDAVALATLTTPIIDGTCHIVIRATSSYFYYASYYDTGLGSFKGCVSNYGGTTLRSHEAALIINGNRVANASAPFTRCPNDVTYSVTFRNLNPDIQLYWDIAMFDLGSRMTIATDINYNPSLSSPCTYDSDNVVCQWISTGTPSGRFILDLGEDNYYSTAPTFPLKCRMTARCLPAIGIPCNPYVPIVNRQYQSVLLNTIIPQIGPYYDTAVGYSGLGAYRVEATNIPVFPTDMIAKSVASNLFQTGPVPDRTGPGCYNTPNNCADGVKNGNETDIDCGGAQCVPCDDGEDCLIATDCMSRDCSGLICV